MNVIFSLLVSVSHYFGPATEPMLAAACTCQQGDGECVCVGGCDCKPAIKADPVSVLALRPRIDEFSPVTRAPLPPALEAEIVAEVAQAPVAPALPPPVLKAKVKPALPNKQPALQPVDRAVMQRVMVGYQCQGGSCTPVYEWHPVSSQPTKVAQPAPKSTTHGRRRLLGRLFGQ